MINAKVGDKVMIVGTVNYGERRWVKVFTVEKETKTQVTCSDGNRYIRSTGVKVGDSNLSHYSRQTNLVDYDDELFQKIQTEEAFHKEKAHVRNFAETVMFNSRKIEFGGAVTIEDLLEVEAALFKAVTILSKGKK